MTYLPLLGLLGFVPLMRWLQRKHFELRAEAFSIIEEALNRPLPPTQEVQG